MVCLMQILWLVLTENVVFSAWRTIVWRNRQTDIADGMDFPWPNDCNKGVLPYLNGNAMGEVTQTDAIYRGGKL